MDPGGRSFFTCGRRFGKDFPRVVTYEQTTQTTRHRPPAQLDCFLQAFQRLPSPVSGDPTPSPLPPSLAVRHAIESSHAVDPARVQPHHRCRTRPVVKDCCRQPRFVPVTVAHTRRYYRARMSSATVAEDSLVLRVDSDQSGASA